MRRIIPAVLLAVTLCTTAAAGGPLPPVAPEAKHRLVVMTDIGGDPDDMQSMVRFLLYACDFRVEGLCTGFGWGHDKKTRPELIRERVRAYGKVVANLRKHRPDFPSEKALLDLIRDGYNGDPHRVGEGMDSQASDWIVTVLQRPDPRPVWFSIWGGPRELAQAIYRLSKTKSKAELAALKAKIRVHSIADQDKTAGWVKEHHPDVFWIYSMPCFRGIWADGDQSLVSPAWLQEHVRTGHGPLGPVYPPKAAGKTGVKEGDTPSFFYVLPNGLSDPEHPEWGGWGGRFRPSGRGREYRDASDTVDGKTSSLATIYRWREAYQNDFEARMDWCVKPFDGANHAPSAVLNGDETLRVLEVKADPGGTVRLKAAGADPDGDAVGYRWWVYREAGTFWGDVPVAGAETAEATVAVPAKAAGRTIHVILEVTDRGRPPLTAYRRAVIEVSGDTVADAPGPGWRERKEAVTELPPPPEKSGPWTFYRGINVGGKADTIDGRKWEGDDAPNFVCNDRRLSSPQVRLHPPTDKGRAEMIHAFRWNRNASLALTGVPNGTYAVYAYVWEETSPETIAVALEGRQVVPNYNTGQPGDWQRLGPWIVDVTDGSINLTARGGAANISGLEVWRRKSKQQ